LPESKILSNSPLRTEDIQKIIEERIFSGELPPGGKVNEKALADELKISRGPIREALSALRHEGLIDIIPNRGGFVSSLSMEEVFDCYDVRGGLAHTAGRILPFRITLAQLDALRQMQKQMEKCLVARDIKGYYRVNEDFHAQLFSATGNEILITMNTAIERKLSLYIERSHIKQSKANDADCRPNGRRPVFRHQKNP
jgi:DNA-binding GntR family transcriptional regulator